MAATTAWKHAQALRMRTCWRAGAAGSFAVQFAKKAGAFVVTTVGSHRKDKVAVELGADIVINHRDCANMCHALREACPEGFDVVMDGVGRALQDAYLEHLAPSAKVLLTGYISEYPHTSSALPLLLRGRALPSCVACIPVV
jgi:NADPH-dependent curcumin reductase CurA